MLIEWNLDSTKERVLLQKCIENVCIPQRIALGCCGLCNSTKKSYTTRKTIDTKKNNNKKKKIGCEKLHDTLCFVGYFMPSLVYSLWIHL